MSSELAGVFLFDDEPEDAAPAHAFLARNDGRTLCLIGDLDFGSVVEAHARLVAGGFDTIDLSGLRTCDGAGLQLLLWARRAGDRAGTPVRLRGANGAVGSTLSLAGLA
jgi:anti-anti-sigma regulatory factor